MTSTILTKPASSAGALFNDQSFSFETLRALGYTVYGGADIGEVTSTARNPNEPRRGSIRQVFLPVQPNPAASAKARSISGPVSTKARASKLPSCACSRASTAFNRFSRTL